MIDTIFSQPTMFQFRRRKNTTAPPRSRSALCAVRLLIGDEITLHHQIDKETRYEDGGEEREHGAPEQGIGETLHRAGSEQEQDTRSDDRGDVAVEYRGERAAEADLHRGAQRFSSPQ